MRPVGQLRSNLAVHCHEDIRSVMQKRQSVRVEPFRETELEIVVTLAGDFLPEHGHGLRVLQEVSFHSGRGSSDVKMDVRRTARYHMQIYLLCINVSLAYVQPESGVT